MKLSRNLKLENDGFTIVELLISMLLLGILLAVMSNLFIDAKKITKQVINQTTLQEELRSAGAVITDEIQRAIYIYPPCGIYSSTTTAVSKGCADGDFTAPTVTSDLAKVYVSWSKVKLASSGSRTLKPNSTTDYDWLVGKETDAPILAMITVPRNPKKWCGDTAEKKAGCYQFVAYYPVKRSQVTQDTAVNTTGENSGDLLSPDPDPTNVNQWVIMEYRLNLSENLWYDTTLYKTNLTVPGVGTMADSGGAVFNLIDLGSLGKLTVPPMRWEDSGCDLIWNASNANYGLQDSDKFNWQCDQINNGTGSAIATKLPGISADPNPNNQNSQNSIPALSRGTADGTAYAIYNARMKAVTKWINSITPRGTAKILVDNIQPTDGFQIEFPNAQIDERGVTEVRLKLQGGVVYGSTALKFPSSPIEFYATTRNATP